MWYNAFNEIDFAGSEALEGMKLENIQPQKVSSSFLLAKISSLTKSFIQELSMRTYIESLTHTRPTLGDGGTSGLAATLCLKIGRNSLPMNMLILGEFHYELRGHFAHHCCCLCEDGGSFVYMVDMIVAAAQHEKIVMVIAEIVRALKQGLIMSILLQYVCLLAGYLHSSVGKSKQRIKLCLLWLRSDAFLKSRDYVSWDCLSLAERAR